MYRLATNEWRLSWGHQDYFKPPPRRCRATPPGPPRCHPQLRAALYFVPPSQGGEAGFRGALLRAAERPTRCSGLGRAGTEGGGGCVVRSPAQMCAGMLTPTTPAALRRPRPANRTEAAGVRRLEGAQAPSSKPRLTLGQEGSNPGSLSIRRGELQVESRLTTHDSRRSGRGGLLPGAVVYDVLIGGARYHHVPLD
jgi:hypothetical protein